MIITLRNRLVRNNVGENMEDNTVTKDDGWGQIDTSQPESKEKEDKVNFEVENSSEEKEVKVEPVIEKEEEKKEEPKLETKEEEETQPEEQPDEAKDIDSKRAQKRIRQLVRQRKEKEEEVARLLADKQELEKRLKTNQSLHFDLTNTILEIKVPVLPTMNLPGSKIILLLSFFLNLLTSFE